MTEREDTSNGSGKRFSILSWRTVTLLPLALLAIAGSSLFFLPVNAPLPKALADTDRKLEPAMLQRARLADGFSVSLFASGLDGPRLLVETGTGDLLVSSRGSTVELVLTDRNGDGRSDGIRPLLFGLNQPHGLVLDDGWLYVVEEHRVSRIRFDAQKGATEGRTETVLKGLPDNGGHSTRTLKKGPDGWFYLSIGSSCNVCIERQPWRAALLRFHPGEQPEIYATGLRNTVGFDWQPGTGALYGVDNGRDWLGDDFPPDELNLIEPGKFYGWPYRNGMNVPDPQYGSKFKGEAVPPVFPFDAHVAPLSIHFLRHQSNPSMQNVALVAEHGSWNRSTKQGYRVVALHFGKDSSIKRSIFLTGFLQGEDVIGRPVDVLERADGSLLITDDYGGAIWQVKSR